MEIDNPLPILLFKHQLIGIIEHPVIGDCRGRIRFRGTTWFARPYCSDLGLTFSQGAMVAVLARQGNTLLILPSTHHLELLEQPSR